MKKLLPLALSLHSGLLLASPALDAGQRQAVLPAPDTATGAIEIRRRMGPSRRPPGDAQGEQHEHHE
ncbi:hypothetical protein, partial [Pseudomonas aeruginosa]|uniref:hypothetical protein n=1 Tax=Pseudomonas aeruginosa TaxID=287 RepID=UPI003981E262